MIWVKIERRIKEYKNFADNGCDNYPINIRLKMAFEGEHLSNPFRKYDPKNILILKKIKSLNLKLMEMYQLKSVHKIR